MKKTSVTSKQQAAGGGGGGGGGANVPEGYRSFLASKVTRPAAGSLSETDHIIRRALAIWRLCWSDVPNAFELLDEKLKIMIGETWQEDYEKRNSETIRLE